MQKTISYLEKLKKNNSRDWYHANKAEYTASREEFSDFVEKLMDELRLKDPSLEGVSVKEVLFRIFRDVRFSHDKTPYKTHYSAFIAKGGKKGGLAGYYIHVSPEESFLAAGIHTPGKDELLSIRKEIEYNAKTYNGIVDEMKGKGFILFEEDKLKTGPKGFSKESPQIEYLKNKHFLLSFNFKNKDVLSSDFADKVVEHFQLLIPFTLFLNEAISYMGNE